MITPIYIPMSSKPKQDFRCPHCHKIIPDDDLTFKEFIIGLPLVFFIFGLVIAFIVGFSSMSLYPPHCSEARWTKIFFTQSWGCATGKWLSEK